jgi:hypothetical protein
MFRKFFGSRLGRKSGRFLAAILLGALLMAPQSKASAQDPVTEAIRQGVIKVIKAIDLRIQRLQTKTIWLQNAQKVVENTMSELKLTQITDWVQKQRDIYQDYFAELKDVKTIVAGYRAVKEATTNQVSMVNEYKRAWRLIQQDKHFSQNELHYMNRVYQGMLDQSIKNLDLLLFSIRPSATSMTDAGRLELIEEASSKVRQTYQDLKAFTLGNQQLSLARAKDTQDITTIKALYALE